MGTLSSTYPLTAPPTTSSLLTYAHSLTWQGKQQDPTGLIHFGARYYDPCSGRFLSTDPISYPISLNAYSYGNGDPINFRDPDFRRDPVTGKVTHYETYRAQTNPRDPKPWEIP